MSKTPTFAIIPLVCLFLLIGACTPSPQQKKSTTDDFPLMEKTIAELQQDMEAGTYTARQITQLYLDRITEVDQGKNGLHAVIELNPDALSLADKLDKEREAGKIRGPLHGIPVLIKDNIDTGDKMSTSAGSLALKDSKAGEDAFIVKKLRDAGAILLGKTNLSEWANFRSFRSSSGWSSRGGQTRNPYYLDRNPCGSSSGSGVAASANLCAIAIGTETNGSVVCPSSANGIVGIKPTVGLWSRSGIIPISESQDTAGPMARTVSDAALLLGLLTGTDSNDPASLASQGKFLSDYTPFLKKDGLKGKRIGVYRDSFGDHEKVNAIMEESIALLKAQGAIIIDSVAIPNSRNYGAEAFELLQYEFKDGLNNYLKKLGDNAPVKSLADVIAFNENNRDACMPYFEQELLKLSEQKGTLESDAYRKILEKVRRLSRSEGLDVALATHQLDALIGPTGGPAWPIDVINGDHFSISSSSPAARSGYPNITVPAGDIMGLPVGLSFFGAPYDEGTLISIAYAFEQASQARIVPKMLPSLDLGQ